MKLIIAIEGCDGSGKHTQAELLHKRFDGSEFISFPEYTSDAGTICKKYLHGEYGPKENLSPYLKSSMYAMDRALSFKSQSWGKDFEEKNNIIVADRYMYSNLIHQVSQVLPYEAIGEPLHILNSRIIIADTRPNSLQTMTLSTFVNDIISIDYDFGVPRPFLNIYLDMPIEMSQRLMTERYSGDESKKDAHESDIQYLEKCNYFGKLLMESLGNTIVIKCVDKEGNLKSKEAIHNEIYHKAEMYISRHWGDGIDGEKHISV